MFIEWDFLLAEIWVLLALAALVGLIAGWLIWGGRQRDNGFAEDEAARLRAEILRLKAGQQAMASDPLDDVPPMQGGGYVRPAAVASVATPVPLASQPATPAPQTPTPAASPPKPEPAPVVPVQPAPVQTSPSLGNKPQGLTAPRDGIADDLTKIKGVGAKMETLCNSLGFWHYDQIAAWSADEIAWVDDNLEGFKGRVTRDGWVGQARTLAKNEGPAFVRRKD